MKLNPIKAFRQSFRVKIILISILFMLITCFSVTGFFVHHQSVSLNDALIERGRLLAGVLAHSGKIAIFSENLELLAGPVDGIARQREVSRVSVFNEAGNLLYASGSSRAESGNGPEFIPASRLNGAFYERLSATGSAVYAPDKGVLEIWSAVYSTPYSGTESLYFKDVQFQGSPRIIGFIKIDLSRELLNEELYGFLLKALLTVLLALLAGSFLIFLVVRGITSPLDRLAKGIKALGDNDAVETIEVDTQDEIGRLAMAFNGLSESLHRRKVENLQLETQLRQAHKLEALGTLAGGIAHDFNNVLSPIFGYTEMVMEDVAGDKALHDNLKQVLHAATRARELVRQILAFSRQHETQRTPIRIQVVIKEALKLLRASLPTTIAITGRISDECGPVVADPTNVHQIIMNLCTNAYHAMKELGGELEVTLEEVDLENGAHLRLTVSDTGIGMDGQTLQRIFDPYFTTKPTGEGTGMGLAMVHGIVTGCGGSIVVESEPGKGTVFQVFFPRAGEAASVETPAVKCVPGGHERILLVDDEAPIAHMMQKMLEQLGYQVSVRTSSLEALEAFAAQPDNFDVVVTDQTMPNMTGDVLAAEVMRLRKDTPVVICTGFSEKITEENARGTGIRALLMKPVLKQEMAATLRKVLDGSMGRHIPGRVEKCDRFPMKQGA